MRRAAGQLESEVLAALWAAEHPLTAQDVQQALDDPTLAYTTVLTILVRLQDKGVLTRTRAGRAYAYRPVLDAADIAARQMRALLDRAGDRAEVLSSFVSGLDDRDERLLMELLAGDAD